MASQLRERQAKLDSAYRAELKRSVRRRSPRPDTFEMITATRNVADLRTIPGHPAPKHTSVLAFIFV